MRRLKTLLGNGCSAVLLGPRDLGKRYVLNQLAREVETWPAFYVIRIDFPREPALAAAKAIRKLVRQGVERVFPTLPSTDIGNNQDLLGSIRLASSITTRRIVILASNVDCLAHHQVQALLRETQTMVKACRLSVVLTGEENLRNLVTGPDSEFNCAEQFVLQGFGELAFRDYMNGRHEILPMRFVDWNGAISILHRKCGGNILLAKAAIRAWQEACDCGVPPAPSPIEVEAFLEFLENGSFSELCGASVFDHFAKTIERVPRALDELCALINANENGIDCSGNPSELELAGLAVRSRGRLCFASEMVESFVRKHYDARRLGDLHGQQGNWGRALRYYRNTSIDRRFRPCGADDRIQTSIVIKSLAAALHFTATRQHDPPRELDDQIDAQRKKLAQVKRLFRLGCKFALGFSNVSFWSRRQAEGAEWEQIDLRPLGPGATEHMRKVLKSSDLGNLGWQETAPEPLAVLPSLRPDYRDAVVILTDSQYRADISKERSNLLKELVDQFAIAYHHSIANFGIAWRLKVQASHLKIAEEVVNTLGDAACDPHAVLQKAGDSLLGLGYKRVVFALVDSARKAVHGSVTCSGTIGGPNVASNTHFSLEKPDEDIQVRVVKDRMHYFVPDWREQVDPPVQKSLCKIAEMGPFVVLPMFIPNDGVDGSCKANGEVIGTIHVERADGRLPSLDDVDDLKRFGRLIAAAIRQSERLHALVQTLNHDHDAVLILDRQENVTYANPVATQRVDVAAGFHSSNMKVRIHSDNDIAQCVKNSVVEVLQSGERKEKSIIQNVRGGHLQPKRYSLEIEPLPDWRVKDESSITPGDPRNRTSGVAVQIRDLSGLEGVLRAVATIATRALDRESVIEAVVETCAMMRGRRARLYLVSESSPDRLISARHYGLDSESGEKFNNGEFAMEHSSLGCFEGWKCIDDERPCLFQWLPSMQTGAKSQNRYGVDVVAVNIPSSTLVWKTPWKMEQDYWVDVPLFADFKTVGKLTLDCSEDLTPQDLDHLSILGVLLGPIIAAPEPRRQLIQRAAEKAIATAAHTIGNKLTALENLPDRYELAIGNAEKIRYWNGYHGDAVRLALKEVERICETLIQIIPERKCINVHSLLREVVKSAEVTGSRFGPAEFAIKCDDQVVFSLDDKLMQQALEEMMSNSRAMIKPGQELAMRFEARFEPIPSGRSLVIRVSDNGPGIPEAVRSKIFDAFFSSRPFGDASSGLGLNLVQRVVQAHGGTIGIENLGKGLPGASFIIRLPEPDQQNTPLT